MKSQLPMEIDNSINGYDIKSIAIKVRELNNVGFQNGRNKSYLQIDFNLRPGLHIEMERSILLDETSVRELTKYLKSVM